MNDTTEYTPEIRVSPSVKSLKEAAYKGQEMPEGMTSAAQKFFLKARMLYEAKLPPDQGRREMVEIERTYGYDQLGENAAHDHALFWSKIEPFARNYAKSPSIETADAFYAAVYGLPNEWRLKRGAI